jgi:hypothetical protein
LGTNKIANDELSIPALTEFLRLVFANIVAATSQGGLLVGVRVARPNGTAILDHAPED